MKKYLYSTILLLSFFLAGVSYAQIQPPVLLAPPNGDTNQSLTPTLDWSDVSGASGYQVQVYRVSDGVKVLDTTIGFNPSQFTIPNGILAINTLYSWRVRTIAGSQQSTWTNYWQFRTIACNPPAAPTLSQPSNGAINQPLILTFRWNKVQGATYYHLQVSTNSGFSPLAFEANGLTDSQYITTTGQLQNNFTYYWRVNGNNNQCGIGPWSDTWYFSTVVAPPSPPTLLLPPNNSMNQSLTPTLTWTPVPGATYYHAKIWSDAGFGTLVWDSNYIPGTQVTVPPGYLWGSHTFYWKVASGNLAGEGNYSSAFSFTTIPGPPPAPILLSPPDSAQNQSRFLTLYWNCLSPAPTSYRIQIASDPNFQNLLINAVVAGTICQYTVTTNVLLNNTWYYWKVNATNTIGGTGPWSATWHFKTVPLPPSPPTLVSPPNGHNPTPLNPLFVWLAGAGAEQYQIQISANASFTPILFDYTTPDASTQYQMQFGILVGGHTYYWRVRSINGLGTQQSAWTPIWNFTTQVTQVANLKLYLEGFYNGTSQVRDTIEVFLAHATSPYAFQDSMIVYLGSDGTGGASFLNAPNGNYYIVVRHRNHLETWSSSPSPFNLGNPVNYDFTTGSNKAYGNNMKQVGSAWVFYGGDANQDGSVDPDDYTVAITQFGKDGYISCDFNGDNFADGYDLLILYSNYFHNMSKPQ
jgi:hypothetical protein